MRESAERTQHFCLCSKRKLCTFRGLHVFKCTVSECREAGGGKRGGERVWLARDRLSYRAQAAGSSAEPGRTTAALVSSSIPCTGSPPSAASSVQSLSRWDEKRREEKRGGVLLLDSFGCDRNAACCFSLQKDSDGGGGKKNPDKRGACVGAV